MSKSIEQLFYNISGMQMEDIKDIDKDDLVILMKRHLCNNLLKEECNAVFFLHGLYPSRPNLSTDNLNAYYSKAIKKMRHPVRVNDFKVLLGVKKKELVRNKKQSEFHELVVDKNTYITDLDLSVRSTNVLHRAGIKTVYDLMGTKIEDLKNLKNLGKKCFREIMTKISQIQKFNW